MEIFFTEQKWNTLKFIDKLYTDSHDEVTGMLNLFVLMYADDTVIMADDDPCMSPALEYDYRFCFVALLSSGLRGFKRHRSYIIIIIIIKMNMTCR